MKMKVYAPNGQFIFVTRINDDQCPLCHKNNVTKITHEDEEEEIACFCENCFIEYEYFSLRNFIMLKEFKELSL